MHKERDGDMKNILVCNQKGGVGKSLIADEIAFSLDRSGIPYNFYDLDGQGSVIHETKTDPEAVVSVIDTPGALQKELRDWIKQADLVIIPTRTTSRDIQPLFRMQKAVESVQSRSVPVLYVLNGYNRFRASKDFLDWFKQGVDKDAIFTLRQSEQVVQASAEGVSVVQYAKRSPVAKDVKIICNKVRELVGLRKEK